MAKTKRQSIKKQSSKLCWGDIGFECTFVQQCFHLLVVPYEL